MHLATIGSPAADGSQGATARRRQDTWPGISRPSLVARFYGRSQMRARMEAMSRDPKPEPDAPLEPIPMASPGPLAPDPSDIPEFDRVMRGLLRVPKDELESELAKDAKRKAKRKK